MSKKNKIRYQVKEKNKPGITLTGNVFLQYQDEEAIAQAVKGDLLVYAQNEALHTTHQGAYDSTGFSGYFKIDVCDGKQWCAVLMHTIFMYKENHFSKSECPIDTYALCLPILQALAGKSLARTYREHYELNVDDG